MSVENTKCCPKCVPYEEEIEVSELARAYVPFQKLCTVLEDEKGLVRGTIFPELFRSYCKRPVKCGGKCPK